MSISTFSLILAGGAWVGILFAAAIVGERGSHRLRRIWPSAYALSLAVYCTAWTFYGTTTQAVQSGWPVPPTFVGTIALFILAWPVLLRVIERAKAQNSTSIADFISTSFGKSSALAVAVTAVAMMGMVPYIALQLKAVAASYAMLQAGSAIEDLPAWQDLAFWVALLMMVFAMLFGTRRAAAEHNGGLVLAMAVESLLKLGALLIVGAFVTFGLFEGPLHLLEATAGTASPFQDFGAFAVLALWGMLALFSLPHLFHMGVVECRDGQHVHTARWLFPLYLLLISLPVLAFARGGNLLLGQGLPSDLYVLGLPLMDGRGGLALLTFLGGLSAATGMVIMGSLALSIMIGNHWLAPLTLRQSWMTGGDLRSSVLALRRLSILVIIGLAYLYSRALAGSEALGDIGAVSFSGLTQLAPAVVLAVLRPSLPARAVLSGLVAGVAVWCCLLLVPLALRIDTFDMLYFSPGVTGQLASATLFSLLANVLVLWAVARWMPWWGEDGAGIAGRLDAASLRTLAGRFLSDERVARLFSADKNAGQLEEAVEYELSAVVGATSARLLFEAARRRAPAPLETVAALVDEASQQARFKQSLLEAALENMSQGISVVDRDLTLVAWNQRYADLFGFPAELLQSGVPVERLVRFNAERGLAGPGDPEEEVRKRLAHMRAGTPYVAERRLSDGSVIEILGNPMPGGGFVATFTDVTASRRSQTELRQAAETLEQRVAERTSELAAAKAEAERANQAKSRFLAAVSHDLLQPINAAHLFTHALAQRLKHPKYLEAVGNIDGALSSTEALLGGILDISRLDAGGLAPHIEAFPVDQMLSHLAAEFRVLAAERGLELRYVPSQLWVRSDSQLLRRVLQNFLSNAVRYTRQGRILIGCRRHAHAVSLMVIDTGPGISAEDRGRIFEEFRSLQRGGPGLGLGLAIAERIARLLGHELELNSEPGRGSSFAIHVTRADPQPAAADLSSEPRAPRTPGLRVLVVDNDAAVLKAMRALLEGWRCEVLTAQSVAEADGLLETEPPELMLLDYHLDGIATGLDLCGRWSQAGVEIPAIVITADHSETVRAAVAAAGCFLLHKPLKPLALKSLMSRLVPLTARRAVHG